MQPDVFDELDWDEGMDLAARVEDAYGKDFQSYLEVLAKLFEMNARVISNTMASVVNAMARH